MSWFSLFRFATIAFGASQEPSRAKVPDTFRALLSSDERLEKGSARAGDRRRGFSADDVKAGSWCEPSLVASEKGAHD